MDDDTLEVVAGGLAEWESGSGPRGETIAPCAYVNAGAAPHLLELPALFHADPGTWQATGRWAEETAASRTLLIQVTAPVSLRFAAVFAHRRMAPFLAAVARDGSLYICPTTPSRGINARLARDESVPVVIERSAVS